MSCVATGVTGRCLAGATVCWRRLITKRQKSRKQISMTNEQATAKKSERAKNESAIVTANHAVVFTRVVGKVQG